MQHKFIVGTFDLLFILNRTQCETRTVQHFNYMLYEKSADMLHDTSFSVALGTHSAPYYGGAL